MKLVLILTSGFMGVEFIAGIIANSVALVADAGHMLIDAGALSLSLFAMVYAQRPPTPKRTYGFYRAEILASLTNAAVLTALSLYVLFQAYQRLVDPSSPDGTIMMMVASVGLAVNVVGFKLLGHHGHERQQEEKSKPAASLNIEAARLEVMSDALGSVAVLVAGVVIQTTGLVVADPIVSIGLAMFIIFRARSLVKKAIHVLMEATPHDIDYGNVKTSMMSVKGVTGVFDLHIWTITPGMEALSAHVVVLDQMRSQEILKEITALLEKTYDIRHATIQIESYHPGGEREY